MTPVQAPNPIDYLTIGHAARDLTPGGPLLGGTVAYAGLTAHALGQRVGVVTSAAESLDLSSLQALAVHRVPAAQSTTFENIYTPNGRVQKISGGAEPLNLSHVPQTWRPAEIVHLAPIAAEVDWELAASFPEAFLGLSPQGWMRTWDEDGLIQLTSWVAVRQILPAADAVVLSIGDLEGDYTAGEAMAEHCRVLVITEGHLGARAYAEGMWRSIPAPVALEKDPTGAGDIFAATLFVELNRHGDPWKAATFANQLASHSVSRRGLAGVPSIQETHAAIDEMQP